MRDLDDTDRRIMGLLLDDARRSWRDIADVVDLSPPAVADRVERLEDLGVIRGFTVDIDRSKLRGGVPVLVDIDLALDADVDAVSDRLAAEEAVEHVFTTAEGSVVCHVRVRPTDVREWLAATLDGTPVADYEVTLVTGVRWTPTAAGLDFALTCVECGNTVTSEGESVRVGGEVRHFCCSSCRSRFTERYERLADDSVK